MQLPDFDTLKHLAADNPDAFEALRQQHIDALIASAPATMQQRLRGLQFQIDAQRRLAKNPMGSCIRISRMMHDSFARLREAIVLRVLVYGAQNSQKSMFQYIYCVKPL